MLSIWSMNRQNETGMGFIYDFYINKAAEFSQCTLSNESIKADFIFRVRTSPPFVKTATCYLSI